MIELGALRFSRASKFSRGASFFLSPSRSDSKFHIAFLLGANGELFLIRYQSPALSANRDAAMQSSSVRAPRGYPLCRESELYNLSYLCCQEKSMAFSHGD